MSWKTAWYQIFLVYICACHAPISCTALIVFSKDRPLQLYAFLESVKKYVKGDPATFIIYHATNAQFKKAYREVQQHFTTVHFVEQRERKDFKKIMTGIIEKLPDQYLIFAVDDIILIDNIVLEECTRLLEKTQAYGFYLRLGKNITYNYMRQKKCQIPRLTSVTGTVYTWDFDIIGDTWYYQHTVDMTIYRKKNIYDAVTKLTYDSPNTFEAAWSRTAHVGRKGLCYANSKLINLPLNLVQTDIKTNRHMQSYSAQELLTLFNKGLKMDINRKREQYNAFHVDEPPRFIQR